MTERRNKHHEPTIIEARRESIAEDEISAYLGHLEQDNHNQSWYQETGFVARFATAVGSTALLGTAGRISFEQRLSETTDGRAVSTIFAVFSNDTEKLQHPVGQELGTTRIVSLPFTDDDMQLALRQFDEQQRTGDIHELDRDEAFGNVATGRGF